MALPHSSPSTRIAETPNRSGMLLLPLRLLGRAPFLRRIATPLAHNAAHFCHGRSQIITQAEKKFFMPPQKVKMPQKKFFMPSQKVGMLQNKLFVASQKVEMLQNTFFVASQKVEIPQNTIFVPSQKVGMA